MATDEQMKTSVSIGKKSQMLTTNTLTLFNYSVNDRTGTPDDKERGIDIIATKDGKEINIDSKTPKLNPDDVCEDLKLYIEKSNYTTVNNQRDGKVLKKWQGWLGKLENGYYFYSFMHNDILPPVNKRIPTKEYWLSSTIADNLIFLHIMKRKDVERILRQSIFTIAIKKEHLESRLKDMRLTKWKGDNPDMLKGGKVKFTEGYIIENIEKIPHALLICHNFGHKKDNPDYSVWWTRQFKHTAKGRHYNPHSEWKCKAVKYSDLFLDGIPAFKDKVMTP